MVQQDKRILMFIGLGVILLLLSLAVVFIIDTHFSLDPWADEDVDTLCYFLMGCIFFPGALRRYRAGRRTEPNISWYQRLDLVACLIGLVFGPMFALSVVQKWIDSLFMLEPPPPILSHINFTALGIAWIILTICWISLLILFLYQTIKQKWPRKEDTSKSTGG